MQAFRAPAFALGAYVYYVGTCVVGYVMTMGVVCKDARCVRPNGSNLMVACVAAALYWTGPIMLLNGECIGATVGERIVDALPRQAAAFSVPYMFASMWTMMDRIPGMADVNWNAHYIRRWGARQFIAVAIGATLSLSAAAYALYSLARIDRLQWYLLAYAILFVAFALLACLRRRTHYVHVHHYSILVLVPLLGNDWLPLSTVLCALVNGIGMEGLSRWGPAPLLHRVEADVSRAAAAAADTLTEVLHLSQAPDTPTPATSNAMLTPAEREAASVNGGGTPALQGRSELAATANGGSEPPHTSPHEQGSVHDDARVQGAEDDGAHAPPAATDDTSVSILPAGDSPRTR
ncbi:hypothetical protein EON67_00525 [archaeon]|nr:MAG: hypothetical protein EON67_00525 [archaeon]